VFKQILVPLDGSEYSERALRYASDLAKSTGAALRLVSVVLRPEVAGEPHVERLDEQSRERAMRYLEAHATQARANGVADVTPEVRLGEPARAITEVAAERGADLVVMSTHGLGASGRYALGSIAFKVLMTAPCPVFMVRIPEETGR
jgi:nucleotide-binding universal stress UspA family protein